MIKKIVEKNPLIWALIMSIVSSLILFLWGIFQMYKSSEIKEYYEDTKPMLDLIKMIFYFVLLYLFFNLFTFTKKIKVLYRIINVILFFIVLFGSYLIFSDNIEYLAKKIHFIPVKQWTENGYEPPEEELSDVYYWLIFICLSFINVFFLNLLPKKKLL